MNKEIEKFYKKIKKNTVYELTEEENKKLSKIILKIIERQSKHYAKHKHHKS